MNSNAPGIYLYYRVEEDNASLSMISVVHIIENQILTKEQYDNIILQMRAGIQRNYPYRINMLGLIITDNPNSAKQLAITSSQESNWIIDLSSYRLIIYENQMNEFKEIKEIIEVTLTQDRASQHYHYSNGTNENIKDNNSYAGGYEGDYEPASHKKSENFSNDLLRRYKLTPITMIIIAINIIVYLITYYTNFLGGEEAIVQKGALSWFYLKHEQEYYRFVTSMFLHGDWSHLFNNMIVLLFVGGNLERVVGRYRYISLYLGTGILAGVVSVGYNMWMEQDAIFFNQTTISIGASGAIFGVVGAILYIVLLNKGRLAEISTSQMILFVALSLYNGVAYSQIDQAAHVGGFIAGLILTVFLYRRPKSRIPS